MPITRIGPSSTPSTARASPGLTIGRHAIPVKAAHRSSLSTPNRHGFISDSTDTDSASSCSDVDDSGEVDDEFGLNSDDDEQGEGYFTHQSRKKVKRRRFRGTVEEELGQHVGTSAEDLKTTGQNGRVHPLSAPATHSPSTPKATTPPIDYLALASADRRRSSFASTPPIPTHVSISDSASGSRQSSTGVLSSLGKVGLVGRGISVADIKSVESLAHEHDASSPDSDKHGSINIASGAFDISSIRRDPTDLGTQYAIDAGVTAHADLGGRGQQQFSAYSRGHAKRQSLSVAAEARPQIKTVPSGYFSSVSYPRLPDSEQEQQQQPGEVDDLTPVARTGTLPLSVNTPQNIDNDASSGGRPITAASLPTASTSHLGMSLQRIPSFNASTSPPVVSSDNDIPPPSNARKHRAGVLLSRVRAHPGGKGDPVLTEAMMASRALGEDRELFSRGTGDRRGSGVLGLEIQSDNQDARAGAAEDGEGTSAVDNAARYYHQHSYARSASTSPVRHFSSLSFSTADQLRYSPRQLCRRRSGEALATKSEHQGSLPLVSFSPSTGFATVGSLLARRNFTLPFPSDRSEPDENYRHGEDRASESTVRGHSVPSTCHLVPDINANGRLVILTPTTQEWRELGLDNLKHLGGEGVVSESESERGKDLDRRESETSSSIFSLESPGDRQVDSRRSSTNPLTPGSRAASANESRRSSLAGQLTIPESGRTSRPRSDTVHSVDNLAPEDTSSDSSTMLDRSNAKDLMIQIPPPSSGTLSLLNATGGDTPDRSRADTGINGRSLSLSLRSAPPLLEETDIFARLLSEQMAQREKQSSNRTSSGVQSRGLSPGSGTVNAKEQESNTSNANQDKSVQLGNSPRQLQENLSPAFSLSRSQSMREPASAAPHMTKREKERERLFRMVGEEIERSGFSDSHGAARGIKQIGRGLGLNSPGSGESAGVPILRTESGPAALQQPRAQRDDSALSQARPVGGTDESSLLAPTPHRLSNQSHINHSSLATEVPTPASITSDETVTRSSTTNAKPRSRAHSRAPSLAQLTTTAGIGPRLEHHSVTPPGLAPPAPLSPLTSRRRQSQRLSLLAGRMPLPHQFPAVLPPSGPTGPHGPRKPSAGLSAFSAFATITPSSPPVRRPLLNKDPATSGSLSAIPGHLQQIGRSESAFSLAPSTVAPSECGTPVGETAGGLGGGGIDDYVIQSEAGKGAYGLVRRARRKGPDGNPIGDEVIIKYIIKSRILADCWKKHKVLGPIPIEIHVMEQLRNVTYRKPKAPHPWDPLRAGHPDYPEGKEDSLATGRDTSTTSPSQSRASNAAPSRESNRAVNKLVELHDLSAWQAKLSSDNLEDRGHPNIVKMLDFFEDREFYYLVMPRFGIGLDLFDRVESAPDGLSPFDIRSLLGQLSDALAFLHTNGIVHRDIKDENVILDGQGHCQLIDFGSAAHWRPGRKWDTFSGTLDYASPEILRGEMYSGKEQDVWALGVVGFVMICGETPFLSAEEAAVGLADGTKARNDLMARCGGERGEEGLESDGGGRMADALDFVERCLELKVEDRPPAEALMEHQFVFGKDGWSGYKGWLHSEIN